MDKPYELSTVDSPETALELVQWFQEQPSGVPEPFGLGLRGRGRVPKIGLARDKRAAHIVPDSGGFIQDILQAAIMGGNPPLLVSRDMTADLVRLVKWLGPNRDLFDRLSGQFCGDLTSAAYVSGLPLTKRTKFKTPEDDAFDVALMEPQYRHECSRYYHSISLPFARLRAEAEVFKPEGKPDWFVSYENLWIRVLSYYTGDPTLAWALTEERDPWEAIIKLLDAPADAVEALLVWQVLGRNTQATTSHFPSLAQNLPDDLPFWARQFDKQLPTLSYGITDLMNTYTQNRIVRTLYGRRLRGGLHPSEACVFVIFGTVRDILEVAATTFWNNRPSSDIIIGEVTASPLESPCRVSGYGLGEKWKEWLEMLAQLAPLGHPLGTGNYLRPTVVKP